MTLNDKLSDAAKDRYDNKRQRPPKRQHSLTVQFAMARLQGLWRINSKQSNEFPFNITGKAAAARQPIVQKMPGVPSAVPASGVPGRVRPFSIHVACGPPGSTSCSPFLRSRLRAPTGSLAEEVQIPTWQAPGAGGSGVGMKSARAEMLLYPPGSAAFREDLFVQKYQCGECHYFEGKAVARTIKADKAPDLRGARPTCRRSGSSTPSSAHGIVRSIANRAAGRWFRTVRRADSQHG